MGPSTTGRDRRLAWTLLLPAVLLLGAVAVGPLLATVWESLHHHDLRMPWLGRPFVGLDNYRAALTDQRLREAVVHTTSFAAVSVSLEIVFGMALALALDALARGRGIARVVVLLPWALPTVVAALVWRFMFESRGIGGILDVDWLSRPFAAWVPIVLGDVWKSTPFVALLLLAGLQSIDASLYEAARIDGAGRWRRFTQITLPQLVPAITVAVVFRTMDAFRVFDLVYVLTGGGPGTATEVTSLYAFTTLLQDLRFGYGSALSVITFVLTFVLAIVYVRLLRAPEADAMSRADRFSTAAVALLLAAWAFPLLWMLLSSFTPDERLFGDRSLIPAAPVLVHYEALFTERRFWVPIVNSLIVAGTTTATGSHDWRARGVCDRTGSLSGTAPRGGRDPVHLRVPADCDPVAALPGSARCARDRHLHWPRTPVHDLFAATGHLADGGVLPAAPARSRGSRDDGWSQPRAGGIRDHVATGRAGGRNQCHPDVPVRVE